MATAKKPAKPLKNATVKKAPGKAAKSPTKPKPVAPRVSTTKATLPIQPLVQRPLIGLSIILERDGKVLMAKRQGAHGAGTWEIQGGHLEFGESFEAGVLREIKEEIGIENVLMGGIVSISNDIVYDKHYVSIGFHTVLLSGEPIIQEPDKIERLLWVDPRYLPEPVFEPSKRTIENWLSGVMYRIIDIPTDTPVV